MEGDDAACHDYPRGLVDTFLYVTLLEGRRVGMD